MPRAGTLRRGSVGRRTPAPCEGSCKCRPPSTASSSDIDHVILVLAISRSSAGIMRNSTARATRPAARRRNPARRAARLHRGRIRRSAQHAPLPCGDVARDAALTRMAECRAWWKAAAYAAFGQLGRARVAPMHVWRARHATGASLPCHPASPTLHGANMASVLRPQRGGG